MLGRVDRGARDGHQRLDRRPPGEDVLRPQADDLPRVQAGDRGDGGIPEPHDPRPVDEEDAVADVRQHARCALALLAHLVLQPDALEDVAGLVGDQLGDGECDRVEAARRLDGVEGQRPDGVALVADGDDEDAPCAERPGELHLQAPLAGDVPDHERLAAREQRLIEVVGDLEGERAPRLLRDAARRLGRERPAVRIVEEQDGRVRAHRRGGGLEDRAADFLHRALLGGQPCDRAQYLELADAPGALGSAAQALAAPLRRQRDPDGGREGGRDDRDRDERRRVDCAAVALGHADEDELLHRGAEEKQAGREREGRTLEAALTPPGAEQKEAEPSQGHAEPQEEPTDIHAFS